MHGRLAGLEFGLTLNSICVVHAERAHPMVANFRVNCVCGAIYDVIEASGYAKDQRPSKCVVCNRELFPPDKAIGQMRLVWRPR
jgi:hypothetical protein